MRQSEGGHGHRPTCRPLNEAKKFGALKKEGRFFLSFALPLFSLLGQISSALLNLAKIRLLEELFFNEKQARGLVQPKRGKYLEKYSQLTGTFIETR